MQTLLSVFLFSCISCSSSLETCNFAYIHFIRPTHNILLHAMQIGGGRFQPEKKEWRRRGVCQSIAFAWLVHLVLYFVCPGVLGTVYSFYEWRQPEAGCAWDSRHCRQSSSFPVDQQHDTCLLGWKGEKERNRQHKF